MNFICMINSSPFYYFITTLPLVLRYLSNRAKMCYSMLITKYINLHMIIQLLESVCIIQWIHDMVKGGPEILSKILQT